MSILTPSEPGLPLTKEQKQDRAAAQVKRMAQQMAKQIVKSQAALVRFVYQNPAGLTPQEVYNGLGSEAKETVLLSRGLADFINSAAGETRIDRSKLPDLTLNGDGTVTVRT